MHREGDARARSPPSAARPWPRPRPRRRPGRMRCRLWWTARRGRHRGHRFPGGQPDRGLAGARRDLAGRRVRSAATMAAGRAPDGHDGLITTAARRRWQKRKSGNSPRRGRPRGPGTLRRPRAQVVRVPARGWPWAGRVIAAQPCDPQVQVVADPQRHHPGSATRSGPSATSASASATPMSAATLASASGRGQPGRSPAASLTPFAGHRHHPAGILQLPDRRGLARGQRARRSPR